MIEYDTVRFWVTNGYFTIGKEVILSINLNDVTLNLQQDFHEAGLSKSYKSQRYIEAESESDIWNHMVDFDNELYRILEEFELAIPKINAEITVRECGFEEDSVDKLEKMFKELIS